MKTTKIRIIFFAIAKGKLRRWQGITLLGIYLAFVIMQVLIALKLI